MSANSGSSRRTFLILSGGAIGALALPCHHAVSAEAAFSGQAGSETSREEVGRMKGKLLVAYASRCGSTAGVAEAIGRGVSVGGAGVDVRALRDVKDLNAYSGVVLGSAIRMGKWLPEVRDFLKAHEDALGRMPVAYFVACLTMKDPTPENRRKALAYLDPVRKEFSNVKPVDVGVFAGAVDYKKLSFTDSLMLKFKGAPEGDFRNWEAIRTWAAAIGPAVIRPSP